MRRSALRVLLLVLGPVLVASVLGAQAEDAAERRPLIGVKIYEAASDTPSLLRTWSRLGIDTAFVSVDLAQSGELIPALQAEGLGAFIITPVFFNPSYLAEHPEAYAITGRGRRAQDDWVEFVCPSREDYRRERTSFVLDLLRRHRPDGLSLDFIRHFVFWEMVKPGDRIDPLDTTCFCDHCLARFEEATGVQIPDAAREETQTAAEWLLESHRAAWLRWRAGLITSWVGELVTQVKRESPETLVNLHLVPWGRGDYEDGMFRVAGQDLEALGGLVDLVSPMTYAHMLYREPDWVARVTAELASRVVVPVVPSIQVREAYRETELEDAAFDTSLAAALSPLSSGVVLWSWPHLEQEPVKQRTLQRRSAAAASVDRNIVFDDFSYADPDAMAGNGWLARTKKGIPGVSGASWGMAGVSFVSDADEPGNRLMRLTSSTAGDGASTNQIQLCHQRKYLNGTYAARVRFDDGPTSGPDGDEIVETFYAISPASEPRFSEVDFEYLPNGGWGTEGPTLWVTTWAPWNRVRPKPPDAEFDQDNTSSQKRRSFAGWHVLVIQVADESVRYFIDGEPIATHGDGYAPTAPMSINFNLWFVEEGLVESGEPRQYVEHVDWVYHEVDAVLATEEVEARVTELRRASASFRDTVPAWSPVRQSLCDL